MTARVFFERAVRWNSMPPIFWRRVRIGAAILTDVVLIAHELLQIERRGVVEKLAGFAQQEGFRVQPGFLPLRQLRENGGLGGFKDAVEATEDGERQDDLAVFGLLVVAAQKIGDGSDEGGEAGIAHAWERMAAEFVFVDIAGLSASRYSLYRRPTLIFALCCVIAQHS